MDRAYTTTDLHGVPVKPVYLAPYGERDVLTNASLDRGLDSRGIGDVADDRTLCVLFEEFCQKSGAIARSTGTPAVRQVAKNHRSLFGCDSLSHRVFD